MTVRYYGIRHHGPGCARALAAALAEQQPDIVLLEGPPEADELLALAADEAMRPPVALLVYPAEAPQHGVFYPFAEFSPEWRAIRHALAQGVPVRFIDLPPTHGFADTLAREAAGPVDAAAGDDETGSADAAESTRWRMDPLGELSRAAGYTDDELWWEVQVEQRRDPANLFEAIGEAMGALRAHAPPASARELRREAHMRTRIREAQKEGFQNVAVVCGAWHVPALGQPATQKDDSALLKGLPKTKVAATWVPWSDDRLAAASGYGAGITAPGWYRHLWDCPDRAGLRWVAQAARLLRDEGLEVSSASVIETVRLADALAALRALPLPGLAEQREAMLTVLCHGDAAPLALIHRKLEVGERIGAVPPGAAAAPLQRDLEAQQKRLRLKPSTEIKRLELDLREDGGRERSVLFHRLAALGVQWACLQRDSNRTGTFRESWELQWKPELAVDLIGASRYGNSIEEAAAHRLCERAGGATLAELTAMLDASILARLPHATGLLLDWVRNQAALASDVGHLMDALQPLARVARYGDVRGTGAQNVEPIIESLVERITVGLPTAASHVDEAAADVLAARMSAVQGALDTLDSAALREDWFDSLVRLCDGEAVAPLVRGYALRLVFDRQRVTADELALRARRALGAAVAPAEATGWLAGLLRGSGLLLLHQDALWQAIDTWLQTLGHDVFLERLPLLRRAFADFTAPERRQMGEKVKRLDGGAPAPQAAEVPLDHERARRVLPTLAAIFGPKG